MPRIVITPDVEQMMTEKAERLARERGYRGFDPEAAGRIKLPEGNFSIEVSQTTLNGLREVQNSMPKGSTLSDTIRFLFGRLN